MKNEKDVRKIGKRLALARKKFGLTQKLAASELGISVESYHDIERTGKVTRTILILMMTKWNLSADWLLLGGDRDPVPV